jgi:pimeloyl-ACP methyl ester carboxylesterase
MPMLTVTGAELYYEVRGGGPPALFIMGASGDGGHFDKVADLLADEFNVVTYDRRGNGRSPRPAGWNATSPEEQSNDAAALLDALGLAPAAVFGTSRGAVVALELSIRHHDAVRGVILHEPALYALVDDPGELRRTLAALLEEGIASGGLRGAIERFWRFVAGDVNWESLEPSLRERMLASAATDLEVERGRFEGYLPDDDTLGAIAAPVQVLISAESHPFFAQAARRLAERLGVEVSRAPGTHTPYLDRPRELVQTIRPFLRYVSGPTAL